MNEVKSNLYWNLVQILFWMFMKYSYVISYWSEIFLKFLLSESENPALNKVHLSFLSYNLAPYLVLKSTIDCIEKQLVCLKLFFYCSLNISYTSTVSLCGSFMAHFTPFNENMSGADHTYKCFMWMLQKNILFTIPGEFYF